MRSGLFFLLPLGIATSAGSLSYMAALWPLGEAINASDVATERFK